MEVAIAATVAEWKKEAAAAAAAEAAAAAAAAAASKRITEVNGRWQRMFEKNGLRS